MLTNHAVAEYDYTKFVHLADKSLFNRSPSVASKESVDSQDYVYRFTPMLPNLAVSHQSIKGDWSTDLLQVLLGDVDAKTIRTTSFVGLDIYETIGRLLRSGANVDNQDATGKTALHYAALIGDVDAADILLEYNANAFLKTKRGYDALTLAVQSGCLPIVDMLFSKRHYSLINDLVTDTTSKRQFCLLHCAVEYNNLSTASFLLGHGADVNQRDSYGNTSLHYAARYGHVELIELLLTHGAEVNSKSTFTELTAMFFAVENGHRDVLDLLLRHGANLNDECCNGSTLLHHAVKHGHWEAVEYLVRLGINVDLANKRGKTALFDAVVGRNWFATELLLRYGADVNATDERGKTLLHIAIEYNRREVYELLILRGANVNAPDDWKQTPLHYAVKQNCLSTVRLLLHYGADPNSRDAHQQTCLHLIVKFTHLRLIDPLMKHAVEVNARDVNGQTPLHLAVTNERQSPVRHDYTVSPLPNNSTNQDDEYGPRVQRDTATPTPARKHCLVFTKQLLSCGAEVNATRGTDKKTPLELAVEYDDVECVELLLAHDGHADAVLSRVQTSDRMKGVLVKHLTRRLAAGMRVDKKHLKHIDESCALFDQCKSELHEMKITRLHNDQTYYDFLRGSRHYLGTLLANERLCSKLEELVNDALFEDADLSELRRKFPIYLDILVRNYHIGKRYAPFINVAADNLGSVCKLPSLPAQIIIDFLDHNDMINFIEATSIVNDPTSVNGSDN